MDFANYSIEYLTYFNLAIKLIECNTPCAEPRMIQAYRGMVSPHSGAHYEEETKGLEGRHRSEHCGFPNQVTRRRALQNAN